MGIFFTSDTHFGHARIIELSNRPFRSVEHMNEEIVRRWNEVVTPRDTVFHLGDVALGPIRDSLEYIRRLNGDIRLVIGNHDRNFRLGKRSGGLEPEQWDDEYVSYGFNTVAESHNMVIGGLHPVLLSHFPYDGDSHDGDRYEAARLRDEGTILIHGHTHSHGHPLSHSRLGTLQIHVGMDAWAYRPVSEEAVLDVIMNAGDGPL